MKYIQQDSAAWWLADKFEKQPHDILIGHINSLKSRQSGRFDNIKRLISAYEFGPRYQNRDMNDDAPLTDKRVSFNHARNAVDTVHAKLCKSRTLPMALTMGGGALQRARARDIEKAIHGELQKNHFDELKEAVMLDGLVTGIGWAHILHGRDTLTVEWAPSDDVLIDVAEARYKRPWSIFRRFFLDRYKLIDYYGQSNDTFWGSKATRIAKIRKCRAGDVSWGTRDELGNVIEVWCGWHQRSSEDADDGAYCVAIDGCTLEFCDWDRDYLPFVPFVPFPRMRQLHGLSMMADFMPIQEEHDKITERFQKSVHRMGGTHLAVKREANVDTRELDNAQGSMVMYDGSAGTDAVKELNPSPMNPQVVQYRRELIEEMYQSRGIPAMAATGAVPTGLSGASGKALQVAEEESAERLYIPHLAADRFVLGVSWRIVDEAEAMTASNKKYTVRFKGERRALEKIEWKKVLMDRDEFDLDMFPINSLAKSPAAKFAQLTELLKAGGITVEQFRRLFGLPDLEAENDVDMADIEVIDTVMDQIVIEGIQLVPESFDNLALILQRGRKFYNMCRKKKVPEERLAMLRDYLIVAKQKDDAQKALAAQMAAPAPAPGGPAPAPAPAPPPAAAA